MRIATVLATIPNRPFALRRKTSQSSRETVMTGTARLIAFDVPDADYEDENCDGTDGTVTEMVLRLTFLAAVVSRALECARRSIPVVTNAIEAAEAQNIKYIAADVDLDITGEPNLTVS